jgi:REP element-mobilizing transposase RayT
MVNARYKQRSTSDFVSALHLCVENDKALTVSPAVPYNCACPLAQVRCTSQEYRLARYTARALRECVARQEKIMPKRPIYRQGNTYHIYNRGAHRVSIFREADNYHYVLRKMKRYHRSLNLSIIAYCLLPNHYHFLIRQDGEARAGLLPQRIFNGYTKAYNQRYGHSGTLFESNYKVKAVEDEAHLITLCRYIHANPVLHGIVGDLQDWPYSNYLEWIGERKSTLVDRDIVAIYAEDPARYETDVNAYLREHKVMDALEDW